MIEFQIWWCLKLKSEGNNFSDFRKIFFRSICHHKQKRFLKTDSLPPIKINYEYRIHQLGNCNSAVNYQQITQENKQKKQSYSRD